MQCTRRSIIASQGVNLFPSSCVSFVLNLFFICLWICIPNSALSLGIFYANAVLV